MIRSSLFKAFRRFSMLFALVLLFTLSFIPAQAQQHTDIVVFGSFGPYEYEYGFVSVPLNKTFRFQIFISVVGNPVRVTSLQCGPQNSSVLTAQSISRSPVGEVLTQAKTYLTPYETEQYYRSVASGYAYVSCSITGVDTVTGAVISNNSGETEVLVNPDQGLIADASTSTVVQHGQPFTIMVAYTNRSSHTLNNVQVSCDFGMDEYNFEFLGMRQTQTTLPRGQSGFVEFRVKALYPNTTGLARCGVRATDAVTGQTIAYGPMPLSIRVW